MIALLQNAVFAYSRCVFRFILGYENFFCAKLCQDLRINVYIWEIHWANGVNCFVYVLLWF